MQIALTKLCVAWPRIHREGAQEAYVRAIIVRTNVDHHRRSRTRERVGLPEVDEPALEGLAAEERTALFDALQALPTMQRKVVVLRHWLGLSVEETARELQIATGTVKSHSSRAVESLQAALSPDPR